MQLKFTEHQIHHILNWHFTHSVAFYIFSMLCNHHLHLGPEKFLRPERKPCIKQHATFSLPSSPGNHQLASVSMNFLTFWWRLIICRESTHVVQVLCTISSDSKKLERLWLPGALCSPPSCWNPDFSYHRQALLTCTWNHTGFAFQCLASFPECTSLWLCVALVMWAPSYKYPSLFKHSSLDRTQISLLHVLLWTQALHSTWLLAGLFFNCPEEWQDLIPILGVLGGELGVGDGKKRSIHADKTEASFSFWWFQRFLDCGCITSLFKTNTFILPFLPRAIAVDRIELAPKYTCRSSANVVVFGDRGLWDVIYVRWGHEGGARMMRLVSCQERTLRAAAMVTVRGHVIMQQ